MIVSNSYFSSFKPFPNRNCLLFSFRGKRTRLQLRRFTRGGGAEPPASACSGGCVGGRTELRGNPNALEKRRRTEVLRAEAAHGVTAVDPSSPGETFRRSLKVRTITEDHRGGAPPPTSQLPASPSGSNLLIHHPRTTFPLWNTKESPKRWQ